LSFQVLSSWFVFLGVFDGIILVTCFIAPIHPLRMCVLWEKLQVKRSLGQFTPAYWDKDEWNPLMGPTRFVQVLVLAMWILTVEVNAFFLKLCLWIPPRNPLNSYRLLIWWLIANPAIREYNSFLQTRWGGVLFHFISMVFACLGSVLGGPFWCSSIFLFLDVLGFRVLFLWICTNDMPYCLLNWC
jgi:hypothetical protein